MCGAFGYEELRRKVSANFFFVFVPGFGLDRGLDIFTETEMQTDKNGKKEEIYIIRITTTIIAKKNNQYYMSVRTLVI